MINRCFNPECGRELYYLREGRVVRVVRDNGNQARLEHFWLCGQCSQSYDFAFSGDGLVSLKSRDKNGTVG